MACFQPRLHHPHYLKKGVQQVFHWGSVHLVAPVKPPLSLMQKQGNGWSRVGALGRGGLGFDVEWRRLSTPPARRHCISARGALNLQTPAPWMQQRVLFAQPLQHSPCKTADSGLDFPLVLHVPYPVQYSIPAAVTPSGEGRSLHVLLFDLGRTLRLFRVSLRKLGC